MIEYDVEISERPLGVRFAHADRGETVVVHLVLENKVGHRLGLLPGDILLGVDGQSVLTMTSTDALEKFRSQPLPFTASFRRFEDDDDFDSDDEENSETDLQSAFQAEDAKAIMHKLSFHPQQSAQNSTGNTGNTGAATESIAVAQWTVAHVQQWLVGYGQSLGNEQRFKKYHLVFAQNNINGAALRKLEKVDLAKIGVSDFDCQDLYLGIQELNQIIFRGQQSQFSELAIYQHTEYGNDQLLRQENKAARQAGNEDADYANNTSTNNNNNSNNNNNNEEEDDDGDDEEEDNWEAPFLPYMYDAPQIKLSERTVVKVYSSRIVAPYKKKAFALYELEVSEGKEEWLLSKRYSEFYRLYEQMKKLGVHTKKVKFPRKGIFNNSTDKQVMEERKKKLTLYFNELLKSYPKARNSKQLSDFLSPSRTFVVDE